MAKDAYYFSHDANATEDQKIKQLLFVYGYEGYGWFWRLVEMMRSEEDYRLPLTGKYVYHGIAETLKTTPEKVEKFISDCISEFVDQDGKGLFESDGKAFWSESLNRRMEQYERAIEQRREAGIRSAEARRKAAKGKRSSNGRSTTSQQLKERKGKERKLKEKKEEKKVYAENETQNVTLKPSEHQKLIEEYGNPLTLKAIEILNNHKGSKGQKYASDYRAILKWAMEAAIEKNGSNPNSNLAQQAKACLKTKSDDIPCISEMNLQKGAKKAYEYCRECERIRKLPDTPQRKA